MSTRTANDDILRRKRALHLRIGRSRRRIDGRLRATRDRAGRLLSWRTYAVRYPGWAMAAALGAGLMASNLLRPGRVGRWLGHSLVRQAFGGFQRQLWCELRRVWKEAKGTEEVFGGKHRHDGESCPEKPPPSPSVSAP